FTLGEYYWNGGWLCVILVYLGLGAFMYYCDTSYMRTARGLMMICAFAPGLLMGLGYGFAQVSRGMINGLLLLLCFAVLKRVRQRRGPTLPTRLRGRTERIA